MELYSFDLSSLLQEFTAEAVDCLKDDLSPKQLKKMQEVLNDLECKKVFELLEQQVYGLDS